MVVISPSASVPVSKYEVDLDIVPENTICLPGLIHGGSNEISLSDPENIVQECKNMKQDSSSNDVGYEVKELPGRGCGLLATKMFYPGDLIMREKPIINMPDKIFRYG